MVDKHNPRETFALGELPCGQRLNALIVKQPADGVLQVSVLMLTLVTCIKLSNKSIILFFIIV